MALRVLADTREQFDELGPYVASIADDGAVAFWAGLTGGGDGVFVARDGSHEAIDSGGLVRRVISHPDINARGDVCFYAEPADGDTAVVRVRGGVASVVARGGIGPLGPTLNEAGTVAYRATDPAGVHRVWAGADVVAASTDGLAAFDGLPVINDAGAVAYRATRVDGSHAICLHDGARIATVADTRGDAYRDLARFPIVDNRGRVAFCATRRDGTCAAFVWERGQTRALVEGGDRFESLRGALITASGAAVFFATPVGGSIGVYDVADSTAPLIAIGHAFQGSTVASFVLNPVSINAHGQLALRVQLADGTGCILRWDP